MLYDLTTKLTKAGAGFIPAISFTLTKVQTRYIRNIENTQLIPEHTRMEEQSR